VAEKERQHISESKEVEEKSEDSESKVISA
jgi:hypothetical protein